jgi:hypothetical protein
MSMQKISSEQASQILGQVGPTLRAQQQKIESQAVMIEEQQEKLAFYQRRERAEKIASQLEAKGLDPDTTYAQKVDGLMSSDKNLDVIEEAVGMSAPQIKLASLSDNPGNASDAKSAFEIAILE